MEEFSNEELKSKILELTKEYSKRVHSENRPGSDEYRSEFVAGKSTVPYAGRVFDENEVEAAVSSTLDFWLTLGKEGDQLQEQMAKFLNVRYSSLTNSGSSANLLALSTLTSHKLPKHKRLLPGDEVITCAAGFPTTVTPIIQCGAKVVFIDNDPLTGNANVAQLEEAYCEGKTKAVIFAHTLGNPFNLKEVLAFCCKYDLWLIEDNCDALGCSYSIPSGQLDGLGLDPKQIAANLSSDPALLTRYTGSWADLSTQSFYPPHHLTMGEGGAVNIIKRPAFKAIVESFRDWGRDCWCPSGKDDTCGKRFSWQLGELPEGYDHKYIYSHLGYNIKPLDTQAAIGRCQMEKLPAFIQARKDNWNYLRAGLADLSEYFEFTLPTHAKGWTTDGFEWDDSGCRVDCSWFGFMLLVRPNAPFTKSQFASHLDKNKIGNRMLFGGNLAKQPVFVQLRKDRPDAVRHIGKLEGADRIMNEAIFIGVYPGLTKAMLDYVIEQIHAFVRG